MTTVADFDLHQRDPRLRIAVGGSHRWYALKIPMLESIGI
jgi:hypothetical protein